METKETYLKLLGHFTDPVDDNRPMLNAPFIAFDKTCATDANSMVIIPYKLGEYQDYDYTETVKPIYPLTHNMLQTIAVKDIRQALSQVPLLDCYDETEEPCEACDEYGEVEYIFEHNGEEYVTEEDCPICDGAGVKVNTAAKPNGEKIYDYSKCIRLGESAFKPDRIADLLFAAETMQVDEVHLVNQTEPYKASLFQIKEIELLIMPAMFVDEEVITKIEPRELDEVNPKNK